MPERDAESPHLDRSTIAHIAAAADTMPRTVLAYLADGRLCNRARERIARELRRRAIPLPSPARRSA